MRTIELSIKQLLVVWAHAFFFRDYHKLDSDEIKEMIPKEIWDSLMDDVCKDIECPKVKRFWYHLNCFILHVLKIDTPMTFGLAFDTEEEYREVLEIKEHTNIPLPLKYEEADYPDLHKLSVQIMKGEIIY